MPRASFNKRATSPASALLAATLAAMLLASAAALMLVDARAARTAAGDSARMRRASLELDHLLALALTQLDAGAPLPRTGEILREPSGGRVVRQDAAGLLDINYVGADVLRRLFEASGVEDFRATTLAGAVVDWRDPDQLVSLHGAEAAAYAQADLPAPANRPFTHEGEILSVLGMTPALYACIAPYITIQSALPEPDASASPAPLRAILGGDEVATAPAAAPFGQVIALTAQSPLSDRAMLQRTIWMRLTGDQRQPILIHRAEQSFSGSEAPANACLDADHG